MPGPSRTNPEYAQLAYRKAIIRWTNRVLRQTFLGDEMSEPKETLTSDEVFAVDSRVPQEAIQDYLDTLSAETAEIDRALGSFKLERYGHDQRSQKDQHNQRAQSKGKKGHVGPVPAYQHWAGGPGRNSR
jgi:hypothetical protein